MVRSLLINAQRLEAWRVTRVRATVSSELQGSCAAGAWMVGAELHHSSSR